MLDKLRERALTLPLLPGVYIMMDKMGQVIYVGKAKVLKNRVGSYFHGAHNNKTEAMISKIVDFDVIIANSEFEVLVLENSLIKHHMPKYNILLRDDKGYPFIRVDVKSIYPSFSIVSKPFEDGALYLGPYGGRQVTRNAIDAVLKALLLPTCGKKFPRDIGKERPCLNRHMGSCRAYCQIESSAEEYRDSISAAVDIFQGKTAKLLNRLEAAMTESSENLAFEHAAALRDRILAVRRLEQKQLVIAGATADTDVAGFYRGAANSCFTVLHYVDGRLVDKDFELLETPLEDDCDAVSVIIRQYYERRGFFPKNIYLPADTDDTKLLEELFSEKAGRRVYVHSPMRGDKAKLVETANINAREEAERASTREQKTLKTLQWLQNALKLENIPNRIEAYDISNTASSDIVASMTVFVGGKGRKREYKRFKIKTVEGQDDYHSMMEVVARRIARTQKGDENFSVFPDIMLIDGGAVHASAVCKVLKEAGVSITVMGMVKDDRHRTRALVTPEGKEIGIASNPAVFAFIGTIQEETHKYAIDYHRSLRSKNAYKSKLDEIEGIGEKRRNALLKHFGSLKAIRGATPEELAEVLPKSAATKVYEHFRKDISEQ